MPEHEATDPRDAVAAQLERAATALDRGDVPSARETLRVLHGLLATVEDMEPERVRAHVLQLRCAFQANALREALRHGHLALEAARAAGSPALEAEALNALGMVFGQSGATEEAVGHLQASLERMAASGLSPGAAPLNNLGNVLLQMGEVERALHYFEEAHEAASAAGARRERAIALGNVGRALTDLGRVPEARAAHVEAVSLARAHGDPVYLAAALTKLASTEMAGGQRGTARVLLEEALEIHRQHPVGYRYETLLALAELCLDEGGYDEAVRHAGDVLEVASATESDDLAFDAHRVLARAHEAAGRHREALDHQKRLFALSRERDRKRFSVRAETMLLKAEIERAQSEERALRDKNAELAAANERLAQMGRELERQAKAFERLSLLDPLTGLDNRRSLERKMDAESARIDRHGGRFSLLMCDIDDFKELNDRHSHALGDAVLQRVGEILRSRTRAQDVPARIGGEEFLVLLPDTALADAVVVAEKIRRAVEEHPWSELHPGLRVTMSVGASEARAEDPVASVVASADEQLYRAKRSGKNRVSSMP